MARMSCACSRNKPAFILCTIFLGARSLQQSFAHIWVHKQLTSSPDPTYLGSLRYLQPFIAQFYLVESPEASRSSSYGDSDVKQGPQYFQVLWSLILNTALASDTSNIPHRRLGLK